jgi:hypothetical protein
VGVLGVWKWKVSRVALAISMRGDSFHIMGIRGCRVGAISVQLSRQPRAIALVVRSNMGMVKSRDVSDV